MREWLGDNAARQLERLPALFGEHVLVTAIALALAVVVSLPLGVLAARRPVPRAVVLGLASVIQTIPAVALLVLILVAVGAANAAWGLLTGAADAAPLRAIGLLPTVTALTLYAILPIARNTATGLLHVDPDEREAARGIGMTPGQALKRVELPLAAPHIAGGVRTAAVWTVGMATLSTLIGQPSLGNYIFDALQNRNVVAVLFGCVSAAVLAVAVDQALGLLGRGITGRSGRRVAAAALLLAAMAAGGIAPRAAALLAGTQKPRVVVGAKTFNESYVLAELFAHRLAGPFRVTTKRGLGSAVAFEALKRDEIACYVDYTGTIWATVLGRDPIGDKRRMRETIGRELEKRHGIRVLGGLGFENAYALAVRPDVAERRGLESIGDLAAVAGELSIAADPEFFGRAEWRDLQSAYGLDFDERVTMQSTLLYRAAAEGEVDVITAYTSDPRIVEHNLRVLTDPEAALPPYEAVILLSPEAAARPRLVERLEPLVGAIDLATMRAANRMVDLEGRTPAAVAEWLAERLGRSK